MEALGYYLLLVSFCFFCGIIAGIVRGASYKYFVQSLKETEDEIYKICWHIFYSNLAFLFSVLLIFASMFTTDIAILAVFIISITSCYIAYLFCLSLTLAIRLSLNIETKELSYPLFISVVIQVVNYFTVIAFLIIPIYITRRKKQRELLKALSKKE